MKSIFTLLLCIATYCSVQAQMTAVLNPDADNTLYESSTGANSNGAGSWLFSGNTNTPDKRRAILKFNFSSLPATAIIDSVKLELTLDNPRTNGTQTHNLHKITSSWGEGTSNPGGNEGNGISATTNDATWIHRFHSSILWTTAGGDFVAGTSASTTVGTSNGVYTFGPSASMLTDVTGWISNSSTNFGWIVRGNETGSRTAKRFCSRENTTTPSCTPRLRVHYHLPLSLNSFQVSKMGQMVCINWLYTNSDVLNEVEAQFSSNGMEYNSFISLTGNSIKDKGEAIFYNMRPGTNYFRLSFHHNDGKIEHSPVRVIENSKRSISIYPNPTNGLLSIASSILKKGDYSSTLYTIEGKELMQIVGERTIDISGLPSGVYLLKINFENGVKHFKRIVKN